MELEIVGEVDALTNSSKGPATFTSKSESVYFANKPLVLDLEGIHVGPAQVAVYNKTRLRRLQTSFDGIPLVGPLMKGMARSRHDQQSPEFRREIKRKVASKARKRIDAEVDAQLGEVSQRLRRQVLEPLGALSLDPTMVSSETTERRFTMRLRLAGDDQLGGHTPRPRAPSDSLASFQVHETAMNNALERLELDGRTFALPELWKHIADRLNQPQTWETDPDDDDVTIAFAKQDAVGVRCQDGRVMLSLSIAKLRKPPRSWRDFQVRILYRPEVHGRSAELVRDGRIHVSGKRLRRLSRATLVGVFAKIFREERPVILSPERLLSDPKLADLAVTQFVIVDGWIGVALGPQRTAQQAALARR
jgi:hypothetical protein